MKYLAIILISTVLLSCNTVQNEDKKTSSQKLFNALLEVSGKATLLGHQDDLAYGIGWQYIDGESDVKRTTGDFPALFGWELGGIELGRTVNLDKVPFEEMKRFAIWVHNNGGINTFSWHPYSAVNENNNSWVNSEVVVKHILPGGSHHENFKNHLDKVIEFFKELKTEEGVNVPFIFRPWHEMDGGWFWWGATLTSPTELQDLFRFTIEYMHEKDVTDFLVAYSPDRNFSSEEEYLTWYPGDDIIDIIGVDNYYDLDPKGEGFETAAKKLEIAARYAHKTGKVAAFTETGLDRIPDDKWFTESLGAALNFNEWTRRMTFVMLWRNHNLDHFYIPHPDHEAADDFRDFTSQDHIWLLKDWNASQKLK